MGEVDMLAEKERKVKELINEHAYKVGECLGSFKDCFEAFFQGDRTRAQSIHKNCDHAETEADILRRKIDSYIYSGAFLPIERKDIYMLTEFIDKIANRCESASDVVVYQTPEVRPEKVAAVQDAVQEGTYEVDTKKVANKVIANAILEK